MKKVFLFTGGILALLLIYYFMTEKIRSILPAFIRVSSNFGERLNPITKIKEFHNGIDLTAPNSTPVRAFNSGVVSQFNNDIGGIQITIQGTEYRTGYAHLNKAMVKSGDIVNTGDLIGYVGSTGKSTGNHLHFTYYKNGKYLNPNILLT
jgi:murein DD-endopeptidase MepM/ murein hydrolase activator NlpD